MPANVDRPAKRFSVPLSWRDLRDLELIRRSPEAMESVGLSGEASQAALLASVIRAGLERIRETVDDSGYGALATTYTDDPDERAVEEAGRRRPARRRFHEDVAP